jgi:hypothetical protein
MRTAWLLPGQIFEETPDRFVIEMVPPTGPVCAAHGLPLIQHLSSTYDALLGLIWRYQSAKLSENL